MNKKDLIFAKAVYRNWGYYSEKSHKLAEEIMRKNKDVRGLKK